MSLVNMKEMLSAARKSKKAVGAFNVTNYETAAAVLKAAEAENEPVIIQLYMRLFDTGKAYDLAGTLQRLAFRAKVPVALHLDHGSTVKQVKDALAWGYTSVMYDGSRSPYDENVKWTRWPSRSARRTATTRRSPSSTSRAAPRSRTRCRIRRSSSTAAAARLSPTCAAP